MSEFRGAFCGGRVIFLCCFFIFSTIFAESADNETLVFEKNKFSSGILNAKITKKIADFANNGYPFVKISPKITDTEDSVFVELLIEKGNFVKNVQPKFVINGKLSQHLAKKPIERILERNQEYYNHSDFSRAKIILENKKYIESARFFSPEIQDSIYEIPIVIEPFNSVLFDGGIGIATFPKTSVTGRANLAVVNILGFGEILDFSYIGEELFYRISGDLEIPFLLATPFGLFLSASAEIADTLYGTIMLSVGAGYFFGDFWTAKFFAEYSEIAVQDTITRYNGIKIALENGKRRFARSQKSAEFDFSAKSGIVYNRDNRFPKGEFLAQTAFHIPFGTSRMAFLTKPNLGLIAFETPLTLHKTQLFRLGGANSVRGYQESSFSALAFGGFGNEFRCYIADFSALYVLADYATFLNKKYSLSNTSHIFGYGGGISIPVGRFSFSLEWAKHIKDYSELGRLHFRLSNF